MEWKATLLAMHNAFDVELIDLRDTKEKVSGAGEVFRILGDQSRDGTERVEAVRNINHTLLLVESFTCARLHGFVDRTDVVDYVAVRNRDVRVGVNAYDDGAGSEWVAGGKVTHGAEGIGCGASSKRGEWQRVSAWFLAGRFARGERFAR